MTKANHDDVPDIKLAYHFVHLATDDWATSSAFVDFPIFRFSTINSIIEKSEFSLLNQSFGVVGIMSRTRSERLHTASNNSSWAMIPGLSFPGLRQGCPYFVCLCRLTIGEENLEKKMCLRVPLLLLRHSFLIGNDKHRVESLALYWLCPKCWRLSRFSSYLGF